MAMAEDGTRDMALEQLGDEEENEVTASGAVADRRGDEPQQD